MSTASESSAYSTPAYSLAVADGGLVAETPQLAKWQTITIMPLVLTGAFAGACCSGRGQRVLSR